MRRRVTAFLWKNPVRQSILNYFQHGAITEAIRENSGENVAVVAQELGVRRLERVAGLHLWRSGHAGRRNSTAGLGPGVRSQISRIAGRVRPIVQKAAARRAASSRTTGKQVAAAAAGIDDVLRRVP